MNFMRKFGYLEASSSSTTETLYHEETIIAAIKNMQKFGALNETGVLDNATLKVSKRCIRVLDVCFLFANEFVFDK